VSSSNLKIRSLKNRPLLMVLQESSRTWQRTLIERPFLRKLKSTKTNIFQVERRAQRKVPEVLVVINHSHLRRRKPHLKRKKMPLVPQNKTL
jgi:hypothetical protein